jgi:hypothetical protein
MKAKQLAAIVLIALGTVGLLYRGFNYRRESHEADLGPLKVSITQKDRIDVPAWAGVVLIAAGVVILVLKSGE